MQQSEHLQSYTPSYEYIQQYLDAVVPLKIIALQDEGGPTKDHFRQCATLIDCLHDAVPSTITDKQIIAISQGIAILSFVTGGIEIFGRHWNAVGKQEE